MQIVSLNLGKPKTVIWKGKSIQTGIFKSSIEEPIFLDTEDVKNDHVIDRKYHGGIDKACYAYSAEAYQFWKAQYPDTQFNHGFFGENLTIIGLDEASMRIGDRYKVGDAIIEVAQPREPCFKLGIRFGSQSILKPFIQAPYPGIYFRVIKPGEVKVNDTLVLTEQNLAEPTILEVYKMLFGFENDLNKYEIAIGSEKLAKSAQSTIAHQLSRKSRS